MKQILSDKLKITTLGVTNHPDAYNHLDIVIKPTGRKIKTIKNIDLMLNFQTTKHESKSDFYQDRLVMLKQGGLNLRNSSRMLPRKPIVMIPPRGSEKRLVKRIQNACGLSRDNYNSYASYANLYRDHGIVNFLKFKKRNYNILDLGCNDGSAITSLRKNLSGINKVFGVDFVKIYGQHRLDWINSAS